jgi:Na+-transporting NADH:ubiquinone oxidoreductase subunit C
MKNFSNTYIFMFSAIMVIIVAAILSFIAIQLKPVQQRNIRTEQMQSILEAVRIESNTKNAQEMFDKYVVESYVVDHSGEKISRVTAFDVDMKQQLTKLQEIKAMNESKASAGISPFKKFIGNFIDFREVDQSQVNENINEMQKERKLPVYVCEKDGERYYVFPLRGKGLWGPIWGYVALQNDFNTIYGANFDHKAETPGLGAEINQEWFESQFTGKKIYKDGKFVSVEVVKGGADASNLHRVDGISGGTITSKGLESMIFDGLNSYTGFFNQYKTGSNE